MRKIHYVIYRDGDQYVAQCLNVDIASQGNTHEEAMKNIQEAVELYYEDNDMAEYTPISSVTIAENEIHA